MKTIILNCLFVLIFATPVFAQNQNISYGLETGTFFYEKQASFTILVNASLGAFLNTDLSERLSVKNAIAYSRQFTKAASNDEMFHMDYLISYTMLKYQLLKNKPNFYTFFGMQFDAYIGSNSNLARPRNSSFQNVEGGFIGGLGWEFNIAKKHRSHLEIDLNRGLRFGLAF